MDLQSIWLYNLEFVGELQGLSAMLHLQKFYGPLNSMFFLPFNFPPPSFLIFCSNVNLFFFSLSMYFRVNHLLAFNFVLYIGFFSFDLFGLFFILDKKTSYMV